MYIFMLYPFFSFSFYIVLILFLLELKILRKFIITSNILFIKPLLKTATFASQHFFLWRDETIRELPTAIVDIKCSKRN